MCGAARYAPSERLPRLGSTSIWSYQKYPSPVLNTAYGATRVGVRFNLDDRELYSLAGSTCPIVLRPRYAMSDTEIAYALQGSSRIRKESRAESRRGS
eukprot:1878258-Rhodomonas_salina.3